MATATTSIKYLSTNILQTKAISFSSLFPSPSRFYYVEYDEWALSMDFFSIALFFFLQVLVGVSLEMLRTHTCYLWPVNQTHHALCNLSPQTHTHTIARKPTMFPVLSLGYIAIALMYTRMCKQREQKAAQIKSLVMFLCVCGCQMNARSPNQISEWARQCWGWKGELTIIILQNNMYIYL